MFHFFCSMGPAVRDFDSQFLFISQSGYTYSLIVIIESDFVINNIESENESKVTDTYTSL